MLIVLVRLLIGAAVLWLLWRGARSLLPGAKAADERLRGRNGTSSGPKPLETRPCATCGAFVAEGRERACGRSDCPFPTA